MIRESYVQKTVLILWIVWLAAILIASLLPEDTPAGQIVPSTWGNLAYIPVYTIFTILTVLSTTRALLVLFIWRIGASAFIASVFGLVIEILQRAFGRLVNPRWSPQAMMNPECERARERQ